MPLDVRGAWRGLLTIAATYVAFLLFAQFGFLTQVQRDLGEAGQVRAVMAAMGIAGLAASLGTAWLLGRVPGPKVMRAGLGAVAAVAILSIVCHGLPALLAAAAGIGASIGLLTVAVAAALPEIVPHRSPGLAAGLATGAAYFVSNVPALFEADPTIRALFPAALALVALALAPRGRPAQKEEGCGDAVGLGRLLIVFLVLIWLDSAAFAIVQGNPDLKAQTWGSAGQKLLQGSVHFLAAAGAGALLDLGLGLAVPLTAWVLFAMAFPLLQHGSPAAGPLYAIGISFYSTALVVFPSRKGPGSVPARWRAGALYGIAGWIGSALGVGMAQDQGRIPGWFLGATGAALAAVWLWRPPLVRLYGPASALGALGIAGIALSPHPTKPDAVARGRQVYIEEGCLHCHSQYVRPGTRDVALWGPARPPDRKEQPPLVGNRRQGPDLRQVGNRRGEIWQEIHLENPRLLNPGSRMPSYAHLFEGDGQRGRDLVAYLTSLGADTAVERYALTAAERAAIPPSPPSPERGRALFATYCASCHGPAGRGDGLLAARLNDPRTDLLQPRLSAVTRGEPEDLALARIVRHGLPPTSMPGHEWLTDQQIADLVAWVKALRKEHP